MTDTHCFMSLSWGHGDTELLWVCAGTMLGLYGVHCARPTARMGQDGVRCWEQGTGSIS